MAEKKSCCWNFVGRFYDLYFYSKNKIIKFAGRGKTLKVRSTWIVSQAIGITLAIFSCYKIGYFPKETRGLIAIFIVLIISYILFSLLHLIKISECCVCLGCEVNATNRHHLVAGYTFCLSFLSVGYGFYLGSISFFAWIYFVSMVYCLTN
ncbi:hypothetical protein MHBO_003980 [Bonamia ostreae]|uniref:Uncharacterized protein n=1 Tax=Bonamia ostreae TaxID=126728 RepID=A0ABV2AS14_9EUKA